MKQLKVILFSLGLIPVFVQAQSDSITYNAKTTHFFLLEDIKRGQDKLYTIDTLQEDIHLFQLNTWSFKPYQTLGTYGTAAQSLTRIPVLKSGRHLGLDTYKAYRVKENKFYDTYSPFSHINININGNGVETFTGGFATNFGYRLNVGLDFDRISSDRLFGVTGSDDRMVNHYGGRLHASYRSYSGRYNAFLTYAFMDHRVDELGGAVIDSNFTYEENIYNDVAIERLRSFRSWDKQNRWKLYHQVRVVDPSDTTRRQEGLFVYHEFDRNRQKVQFLDNDVNNNEQYFLDTAVTTTNSFKDSLVYTEYENKIGLRYTQKTFSVDVFAKNRQISYNVQDSLYEVNFNETYAGANLHIIPVKSLQLSANYTWSDRGYHQYKAVLSSSKYGKISYKSSINPSSLFNTFYHGGYHQWLNTFDDTKTSVLAVEPTIELKNVLKLKPFLHYISIESYQYFAQGNEPEQLLSKLNYSNYGISYKLIVKKRIVWKGKLTVNQLENNSVLRLPKTLVHQQLYYKGRYKSVRMEYKIGVDASYRSGYYADMYNPSLAQFYIQDTYKVNDYMIVGVFAQMQVKNRFTLYLRMNHLNQKRNENQNVGYDTSYQETPLYRGQRRVVEMGLHWLFYD